MQLTLTDSSVFDITIKQSNTWKELEPGYKMLKHVPIQFYPWDNRLTFDKSLLCNSIVELGKRLDLSIDYSLCDKRDQSYLNQLHEIFENNTDGCKEWLMFHEHIHLLEDTIDTGMKTKVLRVYWRDFGGPLIKKFQYNLLEESTTHIKKGDIYVKWQELGKTPFDYYRDKEPNNIDRICELVKPWLLLKHNFSVALEDTNMLENVKSKDIEHFNKWWIDYHNDFCNYNKIPEWNIKQIYSVIVLGNIADTDGLVDKLLKNIEPYKINI